MTKKIVLSLSILILFIMTFAQVKPVLAVTTPGQRLTNEANRLENAASRSAARQSTELANIQKRGDAMITERITTLQNLITRVNNDSRLSADEKTSFVNDVNTTISNLQALKAKIDADTDATTARADVKSIVTSYRVYMIYEPKERLSVIVDNLLTTTTNLQNQIPQIQALLDNLKSQGKDTTALQNSLNDITAKLTDITTTLSTDKTNLSGLSAASANYTTVISGVKTDLSHVRTDFTTIRTDFTSLEIGFRALFKTTTSPSPTTASSSAQ